MVAEEPLAAPCRCSTGRGNCAAHRGQALYYANPNVGAQTPNQPTCWWWCDGTATPEAAARVMASAAWVPPPSLVDDTCSGNLYTSTFASVGSGIWVCYRAWCGRARGRDSNWDVTKRAKTMCVRANTMHARLQTRCMCVRERFACIHACISNSLFGNHIQYIHQLSRS
jgi:hypothetical protein